ncbi:MAG: DUF4340 domain-containing protein [Chromatiales bacterium]|nr:DUF4340 domain-containing protein [Chromatiales bacterium]
MKKGIYLLSGLLVAQVVLALVLNLGGDDYPAYQASENLLTVAPEQIDGVTLDDGNDKVTLIRKAGQWLIPQLADFPADPQAVTRLLDGLAGLRKGWPVATTESAEARFRVSPEDYERKLLFSVDGSPKAILYIGTSPGFRKVHARPVGDEAVYSVAFNTWDASAREDDWIDKAILQLPSTDVSAVDMPGIHLKRQADTMTVADLSGTEKSDRDKVEKLLGELTTLRVQSVLSDEQTEAMAQAKPSLELTLSRKEGGALTYRFYTLDEGKVYALKRSDHDWYFKLDDFAVKPLLGAKRESLVIASQPQGAETAAGKTDTGDKPQG